MKRIIVLDTAERRQMASQACQDAPQGYICTISERTRSLEQNAYLWPLLAEISAQVDWHGVKLAPEEWKIALTASLKKQKVIPGIDGGFVVVGSSTKRMTKSDFSDLLALAEAFAVQHGVKIGAPDNR